MFCRLSLLRFMSYLPLLSFGPSTIVPGSAYLLAPPLVSKCLTRGGPGWPGQSGKELGSIERFVHPRIERQATEVGRRGSGVLYNADH